MDHVIIEDKLLEALKMKWQDAKMPNFEMLHCKCHVSPNTR